MKRLVMLGILGLGACSGDKSPAAGAVDSSFVATIETNIRERMKDPEAVRFRKLQVRESGGVRIACGEFNAKNSYGGYNGYRPYVAINSDVEISTDSGFADTTFTDAYRTCAGLPSLAPARAQAAREAQARSDSMMAAINRDLAVMTKAATIEEQIAPLVDAGKPPFVGWLSRKTLYNAFCSGRHRIPVRERKLFLTEEEGKAAGYRLATDAECAS